MDLSDRRETYVTDGLEMADVDADPFVQFEQWYAEAEAAQLWEPHSVVVSGVDAEGYPTSRWVLLRSFDHEGFVFYTNYESDKAAAFDAHPKASLTFGWLPLRRQVRVVGSIARVDAATSDDYFVKRPRGSQIGAWASPQSQVIPDRDELDRRVAEIEARFEGRDVERPPHWGGYRVTPVRIEFWQGRPSRLHDRILYTPAPDGSGWDRSRLAP